MLAALGIALLLALSLLATPVAIVGVLKKDSDWSGRLRLYWLFGLVRIRVRPRQQRRRRTVRWWSRPRGKRPGKRQPQMRRLIRLLRSPGFLRRLLRLLRDLMRALGPRRVKTRFVIGMNDPADTGFIAALLAPLRVWLTRPDGSEPSAVSIDISPDFSGPRLHGYTCASLRFTPLRLIALCLGFALSPTVIRAARTLATRHRLTSDDR
ncbi:hypothetical protein [Halochromatium sp.]